jgi:hypothetical protein
VKIRRGYMRTITVAAKGRFVLSDTAISRDDVWADLTSIFLVRHKSWHPSYSGYAPVLDDGDGKPYEFEVRGSAGGKYPVKILDWNNAEKILRFSQGPSKNPPDNHKEYFIVSIYEYRITNGVNSVVIDVKYNEKWKRRGILHSLFSRQTDDPEREVRWIMRGIPFSGDVDYVRTCEPDSV